jgi:signal peptidase II
MESAKTVAMEEAAMPAAGKATFFLAVFTTIVGIDYATKVLVQSSMYQFQRIDIIGEYLRLTYIYNPGAAFGIEVGEHSRIVFILLTVLAIGVLSFMYWRTPTSDRSRMTSIVLICAGAAGNLIDRIRSPQGVVDFIDIGIGDTRWPVFNVADIAVTTGAVILALSLWNEDREEAARR